MIILGVIIATVSSLGIKSIWVKNEWRLPIFEVSSVLERKKNPIIADNLAKAKKNGTILCSILFLLYFVGAGLVYWRLPSFLVLIIAGLGGLLLLKGIIGIFRSGYSRKIRLLNYLYSPYLIAWRRDHWSGYTDEQISLAICTAVGIDRATIEVSDMNIDSFLIALCKKTRPQHEIDKYPNVLKNLHEQASSMIWF